MTDLLFIAPRARAIVPFSRRGLATGLALGLVFALPALVLSLPSGGVVYAKSLSGDERLSGGETRADDAAERLAAIVSLIDVGHFEGARAGIAQARAQPGLTPTQRASLDFQVERMRRIGLDFTLDTAQAQAQLRRQIPDMSEAEFADWDRRGLLEYLIIDGEKRYFQRAPSNLFRLDATALARRKPGAKPLSIGPMESLNAHQREVRDEALASGVGHAVQRRVRIVQSLTVRADAVPAGKTVRAWLPYPRALPRQQEDIRWLRSRPAAHRIAPESASMRTVYLQQVARAGQPTTFEVSYELSVFGQYRLIDPERVVPAPVNDETRPHLGERAPHIVYTDALRKFSRATVGEETNPYRIAQKLYAAVDRIPWAGAREYSTISNISDYALHAGHADCGQQTLLLMALLRLNGIPARWQSGWVYGEDGYTNMHDWAWMYLAPYGWVPVDVTTGRFDSPDPQLANFYFGGFDAYRIAYNDDYGRDFVPAKRHERSETVDSQRGEVEWEGGNLYFDQWDYDYSAQVLPAKQ